MQKTTLVSLILSALIMTGCSTAVEHIHNPDSKRHTVKLRNGLKGGVRLDETWITKINGKELKAPITPGDIVEIPTGTHTIELGIGPWDNMGNKKEFTERHTITLAEMPTPDAEYTLFEQKIFSTSKSRMVMYQERVGFLGIQVKDLREWTVEEPETGKWVISKGQTPDSFINNMISTKK